MKTWYAKENGVPVSRGEDCTEALQKMVDSMADGDELILEKGNYLLKGGVFFRNRKGIKIKGYGATIVSYFDPCKKDGDHKTPLEFFNSSDISIQGLTFDTSSYTGFMGRIAAINMEESYFDIRLENDVPYVGNEWIEGLDSCDENLTPNFHIGWAHYGHPHRHRKIGPNLMRILVWPSLLKHLEKASIGEIICVRYSLYAPGSMSFKACSDFLIEDITINACPGVSCVIHPRSANFTFRRFNIRLKHGTKQIIASNTDGIHITGMTGYLNIFDCHFDNMGDDALNMHCTCGGVFGFDGKSVIDSGLAKANYQPGDEKLRDLTPDFAVADDILYFYDSKTLSKKAEATVVEYTQNHFVIKDIKGKFDLGDTIVNSAFYPKLHIKDCSVSGSRARGMLIKTHHVMIEDCYFYGTSGAALCAACGVGKWSEMGPVQDMTIQNCVFEECGITCDRSQAAGIVIGAGPGSWRREYIEETGVFGDITLFNNKFINFRDPAIFAAATKGLLIKGNEMINCFGEPREGMEEEDEMYTYNTVIVDCEDVVYEGNRHIGNEKDIIQVNINS